MVLVYSEYTLSIRKTKGLFHIKQESDDHQSTNVSSTNWKPFKIVELPLIDP